MVQTILHVRSGFLVGGPEKLILSGIEQITSSEFQFVLSSFVLKSTENQLLETTAEMKIPIRPISISGSFDLSAIQSLRQIIKETKAALLVVHDYRALVIGLLARRGRKIPILSVAHGWTSHTFRVKCYEYLESRLLKYVEKVVAVSKPKLAELMRLGIPKEKLLLIENGVEIPPVSAIGRDIQLRDELYLESDEILIGAVGRLSVEKGHYFLLDTAARLRTSHPEARYVIIGDGPLMGELKRLALQLRIHDIVFFPGWKKDMAAVYKGLDIFALPSLTEGLPMALLEAMSYGLPVIASSVGGCPDAIEDGRSGLLVKPGTSDSLTAAVRKLLIDSNLRKRLGVAARNRVSEYYSLDRYAQAFLHAYQETIGLSTNERTLSHR
ncbi:MAG: glycosyltransferase [candidate division Zixibacteria bacterium]|nr:glycosyltransferase [candidate division Zixibacteria bacterium]